MADPMNLDAATAIVAKVLLDEGGAPGSSIHSWRCEYPDRYGPCDCLAETAWEIVEALARADALAPQPEEDVCAEALRVADELIAPQPERNGGNDG